MYQKRIKTYSSLGYISFDPFSGEKTVSLDTKSFFLQHEIYTPLLSSFGSAKKKIIISSPSLFMTSSVFGIIAFLEKAISRGVSVCVITSKESRASKKNKHNKVVKELEKIGVFVDERDESFQKFVLVDSSEVWFGSVCVLADVLIQGTKDEENGMLHLFNKDVWESLYKQCYFLN